MTTRPLLGDPADAFTAGARPAHRRGGAATAEWWAWYRACRHAPTLDSGKSNAVRDALLDTEAERDRLRAALQAVLDAHDAAGRQLGSRVRAVEAVDLAFAAVRMREIAAAALAPDAGAPA